MSNIPFNDPVIIEIAKGNQLPAIAKTKNLFVDLLEDVISQQLSGKVAEKIFNRFCAHFKHATPSPESVIECTVDELRALGLSNAKASYVKNIAEFATHNNLTVEYFDSLTDSQIVEQLTQIKGVGEWTAQMVLIFSLNRPDVFPLGDFAIQQGMKQLYSLTHEGRELKLRLRTIADAWKPNRTIGARYVWHYLNQQKANAVRL
ncbi:MAG TPA: DNA-3-methyladenine glycosylase 2 family protein [Bacteroidetes bacterium]|nr:DNA-3-methyladenine glycosylase 2 family protein [Bacteroidota bacterium]